MTARDKAIKELKDAGYEFESHGAKHDKFYNPELHKTITLKRHDVTENTLRYIKKEIERNRRG